jgi:effector-binding domain-containing protein
MRLRLSVFCLLAVLSPGLSLAQTPPPASVDGLVPMIAPAPVILPGQAAPSPQAQVPPAASEPATPAPSTTPPATTPPATPAPAPGIRTTLAPNPGDPTNVEELTLPGKPAAIVAGISNWEQAFDNLKGVFARIEAELARAGIAPTGKPLTVFVHTDDQGFRYEAMVPIAAVPEGKGELTPEIKFGRTPEGKAFRFVHKDAYEEIDGTYETITAYLDAKDIVARDAFIEEYVSEMKDAADADLEVNIYVQPKD